MYARDSATVVWFRALVMLSCLILVPLAAVFGSAFPEVVKRWLVEPVMSRLEGKSSAQPEPSATNSSAPAAAPPSASMWLPPAQPRGAVASAPPDGSPSAAEPSAVEHVGSERPAAGGTALSAASAAPLGGATAGARSEPHADRFSQMEARLRQLGATYYALESWGNEGQLYRFYCKLAIADDPRQVRQFEAVNADAIEAMQRVLGDVENWRSGTVAAAGAHAATRRR